MSFEMVSLIVLGLVHLMAEGHLVNLTSHPYIDLQVPPKIPLKT